jgi:hypothetical protein
MILTIAFAGWCFLGMILIGLARIKVPHDTDHGQRFPDEAWLAWIIMLVCFPATLLNRHRFARYGDPRDATNPSWLVKGRRTDKSIEQRQTRRKA